MSARGRVPFGGVSGRTHRSAPTRGGKISAAHKTILCESLCQRGGTEPAPYRGKGKFPQPPWPAAHSGASAPAVARDGWKLRQRTSPKCPATSGNPSVSLRLTAPFTQGSLGDRDADCRVGPAGLLAMTVLILCHSEASAHTGRGNPSFLRWTGVRAAEVVGPSGRSTKVPATGRCGHRPPQVVLESCRDPPGSDLSAERVAGQIQSLPDD